MLRKCQYDSHKVNVSTILSKRQKKKRVNTPFLLIVIYLGFGIGNGYVQTLIKFLHSLKLIFLRFILNQTRFHFYNSILRKKFIKFY